MPPSDRSDQLQRAQTLRKHTTPTEKRIWSALRELRAEGVHFRRQAPFRGYVLDFVCWSRKLVIELDGASHLQPEQARHDAERDAVLAREGYRTLRFWNYEVIDLEAAMGRVRKALEAG